MMTSKPDRLVSQTKLSGLCGFRVEEGFKDHCTQDGSSTSLVSSRPHTQPKEEDPADEGAEDDERGGREGTRRILQHHLTSDLDEARVEGEGEGRHPCTHDL
jgi:hypothetical protein